MTKIPDLRAGSNSCRCAVCNLSFKGVSGFDRHRVGPWTDRRCLTKRELLALGFEPNTKGFWRIPRMVAA